MRLWDIFRRAPVVERTATVDEWKARGRLEAEVERLSLEWVAYRDELRRLVQRLEKRDQRLERKGLELPELRPDEPFEVRSARIMRERNGR